MAGGEKNEDNQRADDEMNRFNNRFLSACRNLEPLNRFRNLDPLNRFLSVCRIRMLNNGRWRELRTRNRRRNINRRIIQLGRINNRTINNRRIVQLGAPFGHTLRTGSLIYL